MKKKCFISALVLTIMFSLSLFSLTGCGGVSVQTLSDSFKTLDETYEKYSNVFITGDCNGLSTKCLVNYDYAINALVNSSNQDYREMRTLYNSLLAISSEYIENYKDNILRFEDKNLSKTQKNAIKSLNSSIQTYISSLNDFARARTVYLEWYQAFGNNASTEAKENHLRSFKKIFGQLVEKNIDVSSKMATFFDESKVFDIMQETIITENDKIFVRDHIRTKILPVFNKLLLEQLRGDLNWKGTQNTVTKSRINILENRLNTYFETYQNNFVKDASKTFATLNEQKIQTFETYINAFDQEIKNYISNIDNFDLKTLANMTFKNDLEEYKKSNSLAEVYLIKIEDFVKNILPQYMTEIINEMFI